MDPLDPGTDQPARRERLTRTRTSSTTMKEDDDDDAPPQFYLTTFIHGRLGTA